mgnify:CR=1 FL=1
MHRLVICGHVVIKGGIDTASSESVGNAKQHSMAKFVEREKPYMVTAVSAVESNTSLAVPNRLISHPLSALEVMVPVYISMVRKPA